MQPLPVGDMPPKLDPRRVARRVEWVVLVVVFVGLVAFAAFVSGDPALWSALPIVPVAVVATAGAIALYLLPLIFARKWGCPSSTAIALVNVLVGWTLIGWIAAWVLAVVDRPRSPLQDDVHRR